MRQVPLLYRVWFVGKRENKVAGLKKKQSFLKVIFQKVKINWVKMLQ